MFFTSPRMLIPALMLIPILTGCTPPPFDVPTKIGGHYQSSFTEIPGWQEDDLTAAMPAFQQSCTTLKYRADWQKVCELLNGIDVREGGAVRSFFEDNFTPYLVANKDRSTSGMITGYYVPLLQGSRTQTDRFRYPLYKKPDDMLRIDLSATYPELANYRLRGRLEGNKVVPYFSREEIEAGQSTLDGNELLWVENQVELFFLHIQGSGLIRLDSGEGLMVNYADQNGHPYRSLGKELIKDGEMTLADASMQGIKIWAENNPERVSRYLNINPSYVFFRELSTGFNSPPGALGVPLTPKRSIAIDRRSLPLGAPVFLATTWPNEERALQQLMVAQDTGGAIKGGVRADFFWGLGDDAGQLAGKMKQDGQMWYLKPTGQKH